MFKQNDDVQRKMILGGFVQFAILSWWNQLGYHVNMPFVSNVSESISRDNRTVDCAERYHPRTINPLSILTSKKRSRRKKQMNLPKGKNS